MIEQLNRSMHANLHECIYTCIMCGSYAACCATFWPLHDIDMTNLVWHIAYKREVGKGVVYCPRIVQ